MHSGYRVGSAMEALTGDESALQERAEWIPGTEVAVESLLSDARRREHSLPLKAYLNVYSSVT